MEFVLTLLVAAVVGFFWYRSSADKNTPSSCAQPASPESNGATAKRVRLTDLQIVALSTASLDKPIYGENPSLLHAQMPNDAACFNLRTIESLVKRGYLKSDGKGGYLLTRKGMDGLRSGMGF